MERIEKETLEEQGTGKWGRWRARVLALEIERCRDDRARSEELTSYISLCDVADQLRRLTPTPTNVDAGPQPPNILAERGEEWEGFDRSSRSRA